MNEKKLARICWNSNNWQKPSGKYGKSKNPEAYEMIVGYGHEEWLLDLEKIIDGFHYAYLQAIGAHREKYIGKKFDISLYSIDNNTKIRWWLGEIKNVDIIPEEESTKVLKIYKKKGWYAEMIEQLRNVDADYKDFQKIHPEYFATTKFRVKDINLLDTPLQFSANDSAVTSDYYNLKNFVSTRKLSLPDKFLFKSGHSQKSENAIANYEAQKRTIDLFHNRIQEKVYNQLCSVHNKQNVGSEVPVNGNSKIDIVVKNNRSYTFYEIKTSNSLLKCLREGIPQLLEYAYFPNVTNANKLIIISHNRITSEAEKYLKHLRNKFNLPIYYQHYDVDENVLINKLY